MYETFKDYGVLWVLVAFLIQIFISVRLKGSVKHEYEIKEANLKADLAIQNLRFQHIFQKQADAILQTYTDLLPLVYATEDLTKLMNSSEKDEVLARIQTLNEASSTFYKAYLPNRIFMPDETKQRLSDFLLTIEAIIRKHNMLESMIALQSKNMGDKIDRYGKELDDLKESITPMMKELEKDFQTILGLYTGKKVESAS
jgi:hypothetical protein